MTASTTPLQRALRGRSLVVVVGEGGVGKTSTAAAIAWAAAMGGARTAVLTVDPAPRLGDALGLPGIGGAPAEVALPASARGSLVVMRLDSKRTFDRVVERYAPSPQAADALLAHPLYAVLSERLGGTGNYIAFQRLHELVVEGCYDTIVVDTPPSSNTADMLAAPDRLAELVDTGAMSLLAEPARLVSRAGGAVARAALGIVLAAVDRVTGGSLQRSLVEFATLFSELLAGMEDRTRAIGAQLRGPGTAFVLVTRPRPRDVTQALRFREDLASSGIAVAAVVANRATPPCRPLAGAQAQPEGWTSLVETIEREEDRLREAESRALETLRRGLGNPGAPPLVVVEDRDDGVAVLTDVASFASELGLGS